MEEWQVYKYLLNLNILKKEFVIISVGDPGHFGADPDPNPTPFIIDFKDAKKNFSFLLLALRHTSFSLKN